MGKFATKEVSNATKQRTPKNRKTKTSLEWDENRRTTIDKKEKKHHIPMVGPAGVGKSTLLGCHRYHRISEKDQSLLVSSTQTDNLTLRKPVCVHEDGQKSAATPAAVVEQGYVVIECERRFLLLYTFLKRMLKKKIMVVMSSALTTKYYSELLDNLNVETCTHSQFKSCDQGVLLCTEVAARELDDIPNVDWLLQYDPPEDTKEYIERLGRLSEGGKAKSLLFLRPVEVPFLEVLREGQVTPNLMEFSNSQILNIQDKVEKLVGSQHALALAAREGYRGYLLAYKHSQKEIFNVKTLELKKVALSFGFTPPPFIDLEGVTGGKQITGGARKRTI